MLRFAVARVRFVTLGLLAVLDPDADFALGDTCTVTIDATKVTDNDSDDPPNAMAANRSFSFTTTLPVTDIGAVQGAAHISPLNGQAVKVEGIVTTRRTAGAGTGSRTPRWMRASPPRTQCSSSSIRRQPRRSAASYE